MLVIAGGIILAVIILANFEFFLQLIGALIGFVIAGAGLLLLAGLMGWIQ